MAPRQLAWMEREKYGPRCRMDLDRVWPVDREGIFSLAEAVMQIEGQEGGRQRGHSQDVTDGLICLGMCWGPLRLGARQR